jgi:hypothetical protein
MPVAGDDWQVLFLSHQHVVRHGNVRFCNKHVMTEHYLQSLLPHKRHEARTGRHILLTFPLESLNSQPT